MRDLAFEPPLWGPTLHATGLKVVRDGRTLLDIPDLMVAGQGPTMILGPNGAGKSMLLRCLHGLLIADAGQVRADGAVQAMVFQKPVLLRRSVSANLDYVLRGRRLSRAARTARIRALLTEGGLSERARQPARSLSGGEAQRLAVLRALATDPGILFLDEPTSALDPAATREIEGLILRADRRGTRIVMVTHDLNQARRLGRDAILMHAGRIAEQGPLPAVFDAPRTETARRYIAGDLIL